MSTHPQQISIAVAIIQEALAIQSSAQDAIRRLKEMGAETDEAITPALAHFREARVQAFYAEQDIRHRLPHGVLTALEGPVCIGCGEGKA